MKVSVTRAPINIDVGIVYCVISLAVHEWWPIAFWVIMSALAFLVSSLCVEEINDESK